MLWDMRGKIAAKIYSIFFCNNKNQIMIIVKESMNIY